jgi:DNA polymerase-3 subunit delta
MSVEKIINSWKQNKFKPVYWLQGEEDFFIDQLVDYAEHHILSEAEAGFNLTVIYGRDGDWATVVNACKRYPMFAERQVVILKEAQQMKELDQLEPYISAPLSSTIFVVAHKGKSIDKRTKLHKTLQAYAEVFVSDKIKDYKIAEWIGDTVKSRGLAISPKCIAMLEEHIGNDLNRIANEIDKLTLNLGSKKTIDEDDIEKYIGISKEYNVFELQDAIVRKDMLKAIRIINYFESNPKAVPIQMALPALYSFISKVYAAFGLSDQSDNALKPLFYFNPNTVQQARSMIKNYGYPGVEKLLMLLHQYNLKSIGIGDTGTPGPTLMKEMVAKMMVA